jgi:hypothetical protein
MAEKKAAPSEPLPTIVTLTLPANEADPATMLIQRGELAYVRLFPRRNEEGEQIDINAMIDLAYINLGIVESAPPVIPAPPDPPKPAPRPATASTYVGNHAPKAKPQEPMIDIKSGATTRGHTVTTRVPARFVQLAQPDQQAQALPLLGKLIEGKLWDGKSPIRIDDVPALEKKLKYLSAKDLALYSLTDLVQPGEDIPWVPPAEPEPDIEEADGPEEEGDPEEDDENTADE